MSGAELEFAFKLDGSQYHVPVPPDGSPPDRFIKDLFARDRIDFRIAHAAQGGWTASFPSHGLFTRSENQRSIRVDIEPDRQGWSLNSSNPGTDSFPEFLGGLLTNSEFYGFRAERMNIGPCRIPAKGRR
jgi:hypothetical protein